MSEKSRPSFITKNGRVIPIRGRANKPPKPPRGLKKRESKESARSQAIFGSSLYAGGIVSHGFLSAAVSAEKKAYGSVLKRINTMEKKAYKNPLWDDVKIKKNKRSKKVTKTFYEKQGNLFGAAERAEREKKISNLHKNRKKYAGYKSMLSKIKSGTNIAGFGGIVLGAGYLTSSFEKKYGEELGRKDEVPRRTAIDSALVGAGALGAFALARRVPKYKKTKKIRDKLRNYMRTEYGITK